MVLGDKLVSALKDDPFKVQLSVKCCSFSPCSFRWHRIAYSVQDKSVTLFLDCELVETLELRRGNSAAVSTEGVTVLGTRLLDEVVFEVGHVVTLRI